MAEKKRKAITFKAGEENLLTLSRVYEVSEEIEIEDFVYEEGTVFILFINSSMKVEEIVKKFLIFKTFEKLQFLEIIADEFEVEKVAYIVGKPTKDGFAIINNGKSFMKIADGTGRISFKIVN